MKFKKIITPKVLYRTALGVSFILAISVAFVFHIQMKNLSNSLELIQDSNKKQFELEKISTEIMNRENSLRSYILTGDSSFLKDNIQLKRKIFTSLENIQKTFLQNSIETKTIEELKNLTQKRFLNFDQTLEIANDFPRNSKLLNSKLLDGTLQTKLLQEKISLLIDKEITNLKIQSINHRYEVETSTITAFCLTIFVLVILIFSLYKVNHDFLAAKKLNKELSFSNQISKNAEKVAGIGHWKINIKKNTYFYSENFYRILGLEPNSLNHDLNSLLPYIHPEDLDETLKNHEYSLKNGIPSSMIYRIIRPDGAIRYIKSSGEFTMNSLGEIVKIGVSKDITEEHDSKLNLEEKNKNLIAINAELESFNQIISHDLQEPLRKIQMFISIIERSEGEFISEKGKDYFDKIRTSANRMQNLMIDLVNYTRTIKDNKVFVATDLNEMVTDVIQELSIDIEDKKATISVEKLPEINSIPFQIHQLLVNLISNSLKYVQPEIAPIVKIYAEKIDTEEVYNGTIITDKLYHKIIVSDNGIGFKQEFSEKIFVLFKRLETDNNYSGTGLGLAICKKIVENHNGFIKAEASPNDGAKFIIYLPK